MRNDQKTKKQHAVPQNIMEVEFKLIGDMTVRQFLYVAVGGFACYLLYSGGLPFIIRWPLILLVSSIALGMAFIPMEERGLDEWIRNFFAACYSPTQRVWRSSTGGVGGKMPVMVTPATKTPAGALREGSAAEQVPPAKVAAAPAVLPRVAKKSAEKVGAAHSSLLSNLSGALGGLRRTLPRPSVPRKISSAESLEEENTRLREQIRRLSQEVATLKERTKGGEVTSDVEKTRSFYEKELARLRARSRQLETELASLRRAEAGEAQKSVGEEEYRKQIELLRKENAGLNEKISQFTENIERLQQEIQGLSKEKSNYLESLKEREQELKRLEEERNRAVSDLMRLSSRMEKLGVGEESIAAENLRAESTYRVPPEGEAKLRSSIPVDKKGVEVTGKRSSGAVPPEELAPITSNVPNTISGEIRDKNGKLVPGVMVIIEDEDGDPVRAIKANKLGQFIFSIPLPNGKYTVRVDAKGREFAPVRIVCDGGVLEPLLFREQ